MSTLHRNFGSVWDRFIIAVDTLGHIYLKRIHKVQQLTSKLMLDIL